MVIDNLLRGGKRWVDNLLNVVIQDCMLNLLLFSISLMNWKSGRGKNLFPFKGNTYVAWRIPLGE